VLSWPKDSVLPGLFVGRYSPQPQGHIEGIDAQRGPEGKLVQPILFCIAGGAQGKGTANAQLDPTPPLVPPGIYAP
jgi:hypothetical protein